MRPRCIIRRLLMRLRMSRYRKELIESKNVRMVVSSVADKAEQELNERIEHMRQEVQIINRDYPNGGGNDV